MMPTESGLASNKFYRFFHIGIIRLKLLENSPVLVTLASVGLGLRWQLDPYVSAHLDWSIPLISVGDQGYSLQDNGISFSIRFQPF
jgi:hemolysin activation/secretion protein